MSAAELQDWCQQLHRALPTAQALTTQPDSDGTRTHTQPTSRPPWNQAAAFAVTDAAALARDLEQRLYIQVTGRPRTPRGGSDGNTYKAIAVIAAFAPSVPSPDAAAYAAEVRGPVLAIQRLPAVDEAEQPQQVAFPCPYCGFGMLRVFPRSGRVACLRGGSVCWDANGDPPVGVAGMGREAVPRVFWRDGLVT